MCKTVEVPFGTKFVRIGIEYDELVTFTVSFIYGPDFWGINVIDREGGISTAVSSDEEISMEVVYEDISFTMNALAIWNEVEDSITLTF